MTHMIDHTEMLTFLLERYPMTRDSDVALLAYLLAGPPFNLKLGEMTALELLRKMTEGGLPHFETVRRTRQRIQEARPDLRGNRALERKERARMVRQEIAQRNAARAAQETLQSTTHTKETDR